MSRWNFTKGLHDLGNGCHAYLQPDGSWGWSNAGLVTSGDQTLLIDTLFDLPSTGEMLNVMRDAVPTAKHIQKLVNTHANGDHTFGNQLVIGAEIIACRACAEEYIESPPENAVARAASWRDLGEGGAFAHEIMWSRFDYTGIVSTPFTTVFDNKLQLSVGDKRIELTHLGSAHTRGDILVHIPDDKTMFTGDLVFAGGHPVIWAGPVDNWIAACDHILGLDLDIIVPRHGPISDKAAVRELRAYFIHIKNEAKRHYDNGVPFEAAANKINLGEFAGWLDPERIIINVASLYREFSGSTADLDRMPLFAAMKRYREARIKTCDHSDG